ncbi:MAG: UDP-N-acetylmuramoyl-L-alanine--D-glutamate ligase [Pontiellaceae bacterium]|jgi:UDP-N-acetylmuramoylalanine--D-glutamate ligase|nr:UDP-N-acetylmuramoyl-L-alanine--D-glutamate ligase [Pontiellaceae bacterium]
MYRFRTALVVGCGRSGRAAEALLRSQRCTVFSISEETTPDYRYEDIHFDPEVIIVSPGFPPTHPWIVDLVRRGIPLLPEIELGWAHRHCPVIAVTGSNGKSTVVKWIVDALAQAGQRAVPCGNYGFPVCGAVMLPEAPDWLVIEVSSFQLETIRKFRPDIGLLLNVLPNHLDRHETMENYRRIKLSLFKNMTGKDTAILPFGFLRTSENNLSLNTELIHLKSVRKTFGAESGADFCYSGGRVGQIDLNGTWFANGILGIAGAAVAAVCETCGIPPSAVERSARVFKPLPHRIMPVAEIGGVKYVDDSKATNLAAMCAAIRMCHGKIHLIAGGRPKESDFSLVKDLLAQRVSQLYLIGESSGAMQVAWRDVVPCNSCETVERAVAAAHGNAVPGETVLLSPACTSFDQFRNFNERGECFAAAVRGLVVKNVNE